MKIELSNRHFHMLATLIIGIGVIQTVILSRGQIDRSDIVSVVDSLAVITTTVNMQEHAVTRYMISEEIHQLRTDIGRKIAVPIDTLDARIMRVQTSIDAGHKSAKSANVRTQWQMLQLQMLLDSTGAVDFESWYSLKDRASY